MRRREFMKSGVVGLAAATGVLGSQTAAFGQARGAVDADALARSARKHFIPGKRTCVETMLLAGCEQLGIKSELIPDIGLGLGGGVGLRGKTCGGILGAAMVISLRVSQIEPDYANKKKLCFHSTAALFNAFRDKHGATDCRTLCGLDLTTPEGVKELMTRVKEQKCVAFIDTAARLLGNTLESLEKG